MSVFEDYLDLVIYKGIYEYIAENDIMYWYDCAKDDDYDIYLLNKCEKYDIEIDYHEFEADDKQEIIYKMEKLLTEKLKEELGLK